MPVENQWVNGEIKEELRKCLKTNENENPNLQNLWDTAKADLRGKFIAIQAFLKKQEKSQQQQQQQPCHLKDLEKEQTKPKVSRRKEIIKIIKKKKGKGSNQ